MSEADADSVPLFGIAIRRSWLDMVTLSEVCVDVVERDTARQHQDLGVVEQLADLLRRARGPLMLGCHPRLCRLLDQLLADRVHAGVERLRGLGLLRPGLRLLVELVPKPFERLHRHTFAEVSGPVSASLRAVASLRRASASEPT